MKLRQDISLERLRELLHYDPETGAFIRKTGPYKGKLAGSLIGNGEWKYWIAVVDSKDYRLHRLAWFYMTGEWPSHIVDHKDGDRTNNRFDNLREATDEVNAQNLRAPKKNNKTGFLGVSQKRQKYEARIYFKGRQIRLGVFDRPEAAHAAYLCAKRQVHEGCTI